MEKLSPLISNDLSVFAKLKTEKLEITLSESCNILSITS